MVASRTSPERARRQYHQLNRNIPSRTLLSRTVDVRRRFGLQEHELPGKDIFSEQQVVFSAGFVSEHIQQQKSRTYFNRADYAACSLLLLFIILKRSCLVLHAGPSVLLYCSSCALPMVLRLPGKVSYDLRVELWRDYVTQTPYIILYTYVRTHTRGRAKPTTTTISA